LEEHRDRHRIFMMMVALSLHSYLHFTFPNIGIPYFTTLYYVPFASISTITAYPKNEEKEKQSNRKGLFTHSFARFKIKAFTYTYTSAVTDINTPRLLLTAWKR
jgi:hypothetical protein